jgi:hypothetical protein
LSDIVSLDDYPIRSGIYFKDSKRENGEILQRTDEIFIKGRLENPISGEELEVGLSEPESAFFPYSRWKPGSLVYPLALKKEQLSEWREIGNPEQLFGKKLFYASKRISEIEKWHLTLDEDDWEKIVDGYKQKMEEAFGILEQINKKEREKFFPLLAKLEIFLDAHKEKLENLGFNEINEKRKAQFRTILEELEKRLNQIKIEHDFTHLVYKFNIPEKGEYEMFIKADSVNALTALIVDEKEMEIEGLKLKEDGWASLGKNGFEEGEHELILNLPEPENLISENWQKTSNLQSEEGPSSSLRPIFPQGIEIGFQDIKDYTFDTIFRLSFDYKAQNVKAIFSIIQDTDKDEEAGMIYPLITAILPRTDNGEFKHKEIFFNSSPHASLGRLYLLLQSEIEKAAELEFNNVKVEKLREPAILLRKKVNNTQNRSIMPEITFTKVNPTKYRVKIEGAKEPYTLIFSENFHKGWKAYISQPPNEDEDIIASYFNGEIKEGSHKNVFLDRDTFETLGKEPIAEDKHLLANGYANSWYLTPEDAGGEENYEVIIEFWPQRLFYFGLGISFLVMLGCLGYLGGVLVRKKNKK